MNALIAVGQGCFSILTGYLADTYGYLILQVFFMASVCCKFAFKRKKQLENVVLEIKNLEKAYILMDI